MKKLLIGLLALLLTNVAVHAQKDNEDGPTMQRIHAAKMAYITDRLQLTADQAVAFTPLYNEYEKEHMAIRKSFRQKYMDAHPDAGMDKEARKHAIDDDLDYQQQIIELKRKYSDRFAKAIAPKHVSDLYQAEREFKQKLMQKLNNGGDRPRRHW